jgi:hypothetical protein
VNIFVIEPNSTNSPYFLSVVEAEIPPNARVRIMNISNHLMFVGYTDDPSLLEKDGFSLACNAHVELNFSGAILFVKSRSKPSVIFS